MSISHRETQPVKRSPMRREGRHPLGGCGEYRADQLARDAESLMIYAGSNEVQVTHVANGLLGSSEERG